MTGATLLTDHDEFELPSYVIAREDADRDEVQDVAFEVVEEKAARFIRYAMDLALIRAMGQEPSGAASFEPALASVADGHWSVTLRGEATESFQALRGAAATH